MFTFYTLTARSKRYGDVPAGRFDSYEEAIDYVGRLLPGTEVLIVRHDDTARTECYRGVA